MIRIPFWRKIIGTKAPAEETPVPQNRPSHDQIDIVIVHDNQTSIITSDGRYDMTRFSQFEASCIRNSLNYVKENYPSKFHSIALASEGSSAIYKPRYVLNEIVVQLFGSSSAPVDMFSVSLAYVTKGASYRQQAIKFFEASIPYISPEFIEKYSPHSPSGVYSNFSKIYESEHDYIKAIHYTKLAWEHGDLYTSYFPQRISDLEKKLEKPPRHRIRKIPDDEIMFEEQISLAAKYFIDRFW